MVVQSDVGVVAEDVVPLSLCIEVVEEEAAEEAVFCVFDEGAYLLWGACEEG